MQVDFVTPMEFEFGPEGPIKVGGGFKLEKADDAAAKVPIKPEDVSPDGLVNGKVPDDLPDRVRRMCDLLIIIPILICNCAPNACGKLMACSSFNYF